MEIDCQIDRVIPDPPSNKGEKRKRGGSDSEELHQQFKKLQVSPVTREDIADRSRQK